MPTILHNDSTNNNIASAVGNIRNPIRKIHCVSNRYIMVLDENLVKHLALDQENIWLEQIEKEDGIMLKITKFNKSGQ